MKKLYLIALLSLANISFAQTPLPATFEFTGNNPPGTVEYFIEKKDGANWTEIAKGPQSPISTALLPGLYVFRAKARWVGVTATSGTGVSAPSSEVTQPFGSPSAPSLLKLAALMLPNGKIMTVAIN